MAAAWIQNLNPSSPILKSAQQLYVRQNSPPSNYLVYYQNPSSSPAPNTNGLSLNNYELINYPNEILDSKSRSEQTHFSSKCDLSSDGTVSQTDINDNDCLTENQLLVKGYSKVRKKHDRTKDNAGNGIEQLVQIHQPDFHNETADDNSEHVESHQETQPNYRERSMDVKLHHESSSSQVNHRWNNDLSRMISNSVNNECIIESSQQQNGSPERLSHGNSNNSKSNIILATCSTTNTVNKTEPVTQSNERTQTPELSFSGDSVDSVCESTQNHEQLLPECKDQKHAQNNKSISETENFVSEQIQRIRSVSSQTLQSKHLVKSDLCCLGKSDCSISAQQTQLNGRSSAVSNQITSSSRKQICSANQKATLKSKGLTTSYDSSTKESGRTRFHGTDVTSNNPKLHSNNTKAKVLSPEEKQSRDLQTICFVLGVLNVSKCRDIEADIMVLKDRLRYQGLLTEYLVKKVKLLTQEIRHQKEASLQLSQSVHRQQSHMTHFAHDTQRLLKRQQRVNEQLFTCVQDLKNKHSLQNIMVETAAAMFAMYLASTVTNYAVHVVRSSMLRKHGLILDGSARFKHLVRYLAALQGVLVVRVMSRRTVGACKRLVSWVTERVFLRNWFKKSVSCGSHFQNV